MKTIIIIFSLSAGTIKNNGKTDFPTCIGSDILINSNPQNYPSQSPIPFKDHRSTQKLFKEEKDRRDADMNPFL